MTRTTWLAALCALGLGAAAVVAGFLTNGGNPHTTAVATRSPTHSVSSAPTFASRSVPAPTATPSVPPADVTTSIAAAALPRTSATYTAAKQAVELSAICSGAVLDLGGDVRPMFVSLETVNAPLRFLDVAIGTYADSQTAAGTYAVLADEVAECPVSRTVTPTPVGGEIPGPVSIDGSPRAVEIDGQSAMQWIQVQTSKAPPTSLRTAVTMFVFHNAIVAVSMDQDSETIGADQLAEASRVAAEGVLKALRTAVA